MSTSSLYDGVEAGSLQMINEAIANGGNIHLYSYEQLPGWEEDGYGGDGYVYSVLILACWIGSSRQIIERLLELGADINLMSYYDGYNALLLASRKGHRDIVELLLDRGANINQKNYKDGETALHYASRHGHLDVVELLLDRGANIHEKDLDGYNALYISSCIGHIYVVELLVDRGADINATDNEDTNILYWPAIRGNKNVVDLLLVRGININQENLALTLILDKDEDNADAINSIERWAVTMWILVLQDLWVYHQLDALSTHDLFQYI